MEISVIIPAYNAAATLKETIDSLRAQTYPNWEAILIDDGSRDGMLELAQQLAALDERIRLVQGEHMGVSAARNMGVGKARFDWLLFLAADDLLLPGHLERLAAEATSDPQLDAVYCGWARLTPDGGQVQDENWYETGDMFAAFARFSVFPIHTCIVRKSVVLAVGGMDPSFKTCEEWDLWQRIARTGAQFGAVREVLALYRMSPDSASLDGFQMGADGLRVLRNGHTRDDRVLNPHPSHLQGLPREQVVNQKVCFLSWCAALVIGRGGDPYQLLPLLEDRQGLEPIPDDIAHSLFQALPLTQGIDYSECYTLWDRFEAPLRSYLAALEEYCQSPGLAPRTLSALEVLVLDHAAPVPALVIGSTYATQVNIEDAIPELRTPAQVERLRCAIKLKDETLGVLELPVFDGFVPSSVLADAIAGEYAWQILDRFFQASLYPGFRVNPTPSGLEVWRGEVLLAEGLPEGEESVSQHLHERAGWTLFLQEVWGVPEMPLDWFYNPEGTEEATAECQDQDGWLTLDVTDPMPDVSCSGQELKIRFGLGGVAIGVVTVPVKSRRLPAHHLRTALLHASGFELCRAAVREGLLGRSFQEPGSLHARLAASLQKSRHSLAGRPDLPEGIEFVEGWRTAIDRATPGMGYAAILPRWTEAEIDTSLSRRAVLPSQAYPELLEAMQTLGLPLIDSASPGGQPVPVLYAPDLIRRSSFSPPARIQPSLQTAPPQGSGSGRLAFEQLFAGTVDPWRYTSDYEQAKYEQTLALLPPGRFRKALEIGCAEGLFTLQLAPKVDSLVAADISRVALGRAAERCSGLDQVRFLPLDLSRDPLPGPFDLILCSEVLYYLQDRKALKVVAQKLAEALEPGGYLLMSNPHLVVDDPGRAGFIWNHPFGAQGISETFLAEARLRLVKELRTPLYRIQLFQRKPRLPFAYGTKTPQITELSEQPVPLPPGLEDQVLWQGGAPMQPAAESPVVTDRLPILTYHRVAPSGSQALAPYRVTPEMFEAHLRYLRDGGYYSVSLEDWQAAMQEHTPLPGRAVLITFDDGYKDIQEYAYPLLSQYGFTAMVFLVADEVGGSNRWDHRFGEQLPLLGWDEIHQLSAAGFAFGSHSASHRDLRDVSPIEVVRQALRSRRILEAGLKLPVRAFAYPHGGENRLIRHILGACGYIFGLTTQPSRCSLWDPLLALPRLDMHGMDRFEDFVRKLADG